METQPNVRSAAIIGRPMIFLSLMVLVAFGLRAISILYFRTYEYDDTWQAGCEMGRLAESIANGHGLSLAETEYPHSDTLKPTAWFGPIYPYFLGFFFSVFGPYTPGALIAGQLANSLISALTLVPLFAVADRMFGRSVALVTAAVWAAYPHCIAQATQLWLTNVFTLGLVCLVWSALHCRQSRSVAWALVTGALMIGMVLTDGVAAGVAPVICLWLLLSGPLPFRLRLRSVALICLTSAVFLAPWIMRNRQVFNEWIPLRSSWGLNLFIGNNPESDGTYRKPRAMVAKQLTAQEEAYLATASEYQYSQFLGQKAKAWIMANPVKFLRITVRRVVNYWLQEVARPEPHSIRWWAKLGITAPLVGAAMAGFAVSLFRTRSMTLLHWIVVFFPAGYYVALSNIPRYRHPMMPLLILFASYSLVAMVDAVRRRKCATA